MRNELKRAFRPAVESCEPRALAAAGVTAAAAQVEARQAAKPPKPPAPKPVATASNQAWVELVNMTGRDLDYQIKLGPYANGRFFTDSIAAGASQYRYSSLIANGRRVKADFAIRFGDGPATPLSTGASRPAARKYYLFMDSNFRYYVSPFMGTTPPTRPVPPPNRPVATASDQAWVEIVNTTGRDIEYQIKLGPYANGRFLTVDIGPGQSQSWWSSLIAYGRRVGADFAIRFGNGPVTPLLTGPSRQSAMGYYIFMDSNFDYYVSPFVRSRAAAEGG